MSHPTGLAPFLLNDGHHLPAVGLGTFGLTGEDGIAALVEALRSGYRLLDTAVGYGNEAEVGAAVRRSGIPGSQIVVTTKIRGRGLGYDQARRSIAESRETLNVEQIGLHLIHWPIPRLDRYVDTWRAMVDAQADGEIRSIGVSNFTQPHLTRIIDATGVTPAVNQIEVHPHPPQIEQRAVNSDHGVLTQSWSPLGRGRALLELPEVTGPARRLGVTPAQVVLRWHHQLGLLPVPKSGNGQRQRDNLDLAGFELDDDEVSALTGLGRLDGASASFTPGSRTPWKVNPVGQTLVVTSGVGWMQIEGEQIVEVRAGDFAWCPPGQRHWEGATLNQSMTYVAIQEEGDAGSVKFLDKVTDEQYQAGPPPA